MMITILECDICQKQFNIKDNEETPGAEEILNVIDAAGKKFFFCSLPCIKKWLEKYTCPYKTEPRRVTGTADEYLPGLG